MENLTLLHLLLQVTLVLSSFTGIVFAYVFLTSDHGASAGKKSVSSSSQLQV